MKEKIVLLFGSFNPVTIAHVETLTKSIDLVNASKGLFIPSSYEYITSKMFKSKGRMALSNEIRTNMLNKVCEKDMRLQVCKYEMDNKVLNNTLQTINYLIDKYPNSKLYFTCGADKLKSLSKWKNIDHIFQSVEVIVFKRSNVNIDLVINNDKVLCKYIDKFHIMEELNEYSISSSKVRSLFFNGSNEYKKLLPEGVSEIFEKLNPYDYREFKLHEWIQLMHKFGGMHGPEKALKELYLVNKNIIKDFIVKDTKFINDNEIIYDVNYEGEISCVNSDLITECCKLNKEGFNPVILNVCNREFACGKLDKGYFKSINDEEELCRISNLSNYLLPYGKSNLKIVKECSTAHKYNMYPLDRKTVIYCEDVTFFRENRNNWYKELDKLIECDILLTPSISLRESESVLLREDLKFLCNNRLNDEGKGILKNSIINLFNNSINLKKDSLIISDFGIRSYYLNEEDVLEVFLDVLNNYKNKFKKIIFVLPYKRINYYKKFYEKFKGDI